MPSQLLQQSHDIAYDLSFAVLDLLPFVLLVLQLGQPLVLLIGIWLGFAYMVLLLLT